MTAGMTIPSHVAKGLLLLALLLPPAAATAQTFTELLGRPTASSMTMSILFNQQADVYWEYGTSAGSYPLATAVFVGNAAIPREVDFTGLAANTRYYYRTRYRLSGSGAAYSAGPAHSFYTQRSPGSTFAFTVEADEHLYDPSQGSPNLYRINLANQKKDNPDFMLSLGDIFGDDHTPLTTTSAQMKAKHLFYRQFLGDICPSVPFYISLGNHEGENDYFLSQTPPNNIATYATLWRKYYYPNPAPNGFYSGNTAVEGFGMGQPQNYYSWTWGDALFVVLDIYRSQGPASANPRGWDWTLGTTQYQWLTNVLQTSTAKYKFVFAHHPNGQQRGGINCARMFEWGGYDNTGGVLTNRFALHRPGWAKPIHQLLVDNGVNIFFQGHDHLFAKEVLDGVIYQEVPMAADSTYRSGVTDWGSYYSQNIRDGSGHVRVRVSPGCVNVDYVKAYLPADTLGVNKNRQVAFSYSFGTGCVATGVVGVAPEELMTAYPNPATTGVSVFAPSAKPYGRSVRLCNLLGQVILTTEIKGGGKAVQLDLSTVTAGIYFLKITDQSTQVIKISRE